MEKTIENLKQAFSGESEARNKYTFFASVARKQGWLEIAQIFEETAKNEKEHAEIIMKLLKGIGDTGANLQAAIKGESYEFQEMYPGFLKVAEEEGFTEAAKYFKEVAEVEEHHAKRFQELYNMLEKGELTKKPSVTKWKCNECGYVYEGNQPPDVCPLCGHSHEFYTPIYEPY